MTVSAELPTVTIAIDSRIKELCQSLNIPFIEDKDFDITAIAHLWKNIKFDESFDQNRILLAHRTINLLQDNDLKPPDLLQSFVQENGK